MQRVSSDNKVVTQTPVTESIFTATVPGPDHAECFTRTQLNKRKDMMLCCQTLTAQIHCERQWQDNNIDFTEDFCTYYAINHTINY